MSSPAVLTSKLKCKKMQNGKTLKREDKGSVYLKEEGDTDR
jgi:hypothetical protein